MQYFGFATCVQNNSFLFLLADDTDSDVDMEEHKKKLEHIHSVRGQHVRIRTFAFVIACTRDS